VELSPEKMAKISLAYSEVIALIYSRSSTNPANLVKIGPVIGLIEIVQNIFKQRHFISPLRLKAGQAKVSLGINSALISPRWHCHRPQ